MATIIQRKDHYCVVYNFTDENGNRKQNGKPLRRMQKQKRDGRK